MSHFTSINKGVLRDNISGHELMRFGAEPEQNKHYAVVLMCGHCGRAYFIPVLHGFWNHDKEEIKQAAIAIPRTKRDFKDFILAVEEIDDLQFRLINAINDNDEYLIGKDTNFMNDNSHARRIIMPNMIKQVYDNEKKIHLKKDISRDETLIKVAEDYPEHMILQRVFAPRKTNVKTETKIINGKIIKEETQIYEFPKKVKISDFIDDYFAVQVYEMGICKNKLHLIAMFYELYGENNALGISYNNGVLSYVDQNKQLVEVELNDAMKNYIERYNIGYMSRRTKKDIYSEVEKIEGEKCTSTTGLERFNKKFEKFKKMQNKNGMQPGDE